MNNNSLLPFERNRYYAGKMLTSSDFAAEQEYMNNKRRFLNNLMYGSGIVCGLGVYSLDDLSLFVESGFAIDSFGREIVIENSVVKKLSAIEGFEQIDSNELTLCLRYKEENVHPVYSVNRQKSDSEYEYNRIKEGYELFLAASDEVVNNTGVETEFLTNGVLYQDDNYMVIAEMPATACVNNYTRLQIKLVKLSDSAELFSIKGCLQLPAFTTEEGSHELCIEFDKISLVKNECIIKDYWLYIGNDNISETELILKNGSCAITINDETVHYSPDFAMKIIISDITPRELADRELGRVSLEMYEMGEVSDFICLADISLIRTNSAYIIENIRERNVKKYIETPSRNILRSDYLEYFRTADTAVGCDSKDKPEKESRPVYEGNDGRLKVATGIVEILVKDRARAGDVFYSGEIMHGLGIGTVYVEVGQEVIENNKVTGDNTKSTIYGNAGLFKSNNKKGPETDTAVKVFNDKGSFVVAAQFQKDYDCLILTYRWVAIKLADNDEDNNAIVGQRIEAETPTLVLKTGESRYLGVKFHNMEKCSIGYEVQDKNGGEITLDGIYTAPNKEGVYEVKISCIEKPHICTYVYVIVKKK